METEIIQLKLEWSEVADKLLHRLQRQAKRDRDALEEAGPTIVPVPVPGDGAYGALPGAHGKAALYRELVKRGRAFGVRS